MSPPTPAREASDIDNTTSASSPPAHSIGSKSSFLTPPYVNAVPVFPSHSHTHTTPTTTTSRQSTLSSLFTVNESSVRYDAITHHSHVSPVGNGNDVTVVGPAITNNTINAGLISPDGTPSPHSHRRHRRQSEATRSAEATTPATRSLPPVFPAPTRSSTSLSVPSTIPTEDQPLPSFGELVEPVQQHQRQQQHQRDLQRSNSQPTHDRHQLQRQRQRQRQQQPRPEDVEAEGFPAFPGFSTAIPTSPSPQSTPSPSSQSVHSHHPSSPNRPLSARSRARKAKFLSLSADSLRGTAADTAAAATSPATFSPPYGRICVYQLAKEHDQEYKDSVRADLRRITEINRRRAEKKNAEEAARIEIERADVVLRAAAVAAAAEARVHAHADYSHHQQAHAHARAHSQGQANEHAREIDHVIEGRPRGLSLKLPGVATVAAANAAAAAAAGKSDHTGLRPLAPAPGARTRRRDTLPESLGPDPTSRVRKRASRAKTITSTNPATATSTILSEIPHSGSALISPTLHTPTTSSATLQKPRAPSMREDRDFGSVPDHCPATTSTIDSRSFKTDWKGQPLDLSSDPDRHLLHAAEVTVASTLRLSCAVYLTSKRRIFFARLEAFRKGKEFRKTDAQQACNIDVNKASKLWTAFDRVGWFKKDHFMAALAEKEKSAVGGGE